MQTFLRQTGPSLSPFNAWVMLKSLETLALRINQQMQSAEKITQFLSRHPQIAMLRYPGDPAHPQAEIVRRQMRGGGTLVAFELHGGKAAAFAFANELNIIKISNNLGDAKSLITHPATTTHQRLTPAGRALMGIADGLLRLSVGLEDQDDLIADIAGALQALPAQGLAAE
jgi:O-succinylhomoserine sulfhydrylase